MGEKSQNTNLASEFYVLSMLHRLGANAHLTLGNKKSVDIVVEKKGKILTIDVKGLLDKSLFLMDNWVEKDSHHYIVFVSFLKKIKDPLTPPAVFVVPSSHIKRILYINPKGNRKGVPFSKLSKYKDKWKYVV